VTDEDIAAAYSDPDRMIPEKETGVTRQLDHAIILKSYPRQSWQFPVTFG
jgi:hypothetical protein